MPRKILIRSGSLEAVAELNQSKTAQAIWDILPLEARVETWGDEIYFSIPLHIELEDGKEVVNIGDLGFWPPGDAFCIFFGLTPLSRKNKILPASPVSVFGKIVSDVSIFKKVKSGSVISISQYKEI